MGWGESGWASGTWADSSALSSSGVSRIKKQVVRYIIDMPIKSRDDKDVMEIMSILASVDFL